MVSENNFKIFSRMNKNIKKIGGNRMINWSQKLVRFVVFLVMIIGCNNSAYDQINSISLEQGLDNEPESPDAAEIFYDAVSGYFSSWGTNMSGSGYNYYIVPGSKTWEYAGRRIISNTGWWDSYGGLYAGGVPGGLMVNGLYRQAYSCNEAIGIMTLGGTPTNYQWTDLGAPLVTWSNTPPQYGSLIDVSLMIDFEKRLWLVHGCGSIWIVELDPITLKLKHNPNDTDFDDDDR
jgi:hypothetical protein